MTLDSFLIAYGSALILPAAVIEGPVVSIISGVLSAEGYLDWYCALSLLVCGDLIGDAIYYWVGRTGRTPLVGLGRWLGVRSGPSPALQRDLKRNATRMLCIGKWTHSIGCLVLIGCGMLRLPLARFLLVNLLATVPKSAALFGFGYFAAGYFPPLQRHFVLTTMVLSAIGVTAMMLLLRRADSIPDAGSGR